MAVQAWIVAGYVHGAASAIRICGGVVCHVTARGNDRVAVFHTEEGRRHLLDVLVSQRDETTSNGDEV